MAKRPIVPPVPLDRLTAVIDRLGAEGDTARRIATTSYRTGWTLAHRHPGKGANLVAVVEDGDGTMSVDRPAMVAQAIGAAEALADAGRCQRCGRELRDPVSVRRQVGPDCWADGYRPTLVDSHDTPLDPELLDAAVRLLDAFAEDAR